MITGETKQNQRLSQDLTVVLIRGNGSPRSFRLSLQALQRSLTALGFLFVFALLAAIFFFVLSFLREPEVTSGPRIAPPAPVVSAPPATEPAVNLETPATEAPAQPAGAPPTSFWQKLTRSGGESNSGDSELKMEVEGLRADVAKLNAQLDGRKEIPTGNLTGLLQFFGPRNLLQAEGTSVMQVKNPNVVKDAASKQIHLDFELHNTDSRQRLERGYIVVLGKTNDVLSVYPSNAFAPSQNIVLDYTKGETFAVSRFRQARASFPAGLFEGKKPFFQILLFSTDGKVVANQHVEGQ